ncbi:hypothetical protein T06_11188 [Trichinella sp. T6]|nr:hypothetical protein T06_11188 [Trichinella sp. T6]
MLLTNTEIPALVEYREMFNKHLVHEISENPVQRILTLLMIIAA